MKKQQNPMDLKLDSKSVTSLSLLRHVVLNQCTFTRALRQETLQELVTHTQQ